MDNIVERVKKIVAEQLGVNEAVGKGTVFGGLRERLNNFRFNTLLAMLDGAEAVLAGAEPPQGFFVDGNGDPWRDVLTALRELAGGPAEAKGKDDGEKTRILWTLSIGKLGELLDIKPFEQKRSRRGWSTPKAMPLSRLAGDQSLTLEDAKLARCLRPDRYYSKRYTLDLAAAVGALVGHPAVALEAAPDVLVELVETQPELEVVRRGDKIAMSAFGAGLTYGAVVMECIRQHTDICIQKDGLQEKYSSSDKTGGIPQGPGQDAQAGGRKVQGVP